MGQGVKILDTGAKRLLSGSDAKEVESVLYDLLRRGAKVVSPLTQLGDKWIAACTPPIQPHPADSTDTLRFVEPAAAPPGEASDPCRVESLGFKRIVTGPSRSLVRLKAEELVQMGATLIGDVEEVDGIWAVVCDTGGIQDTGYKW